MLEGEWCLRRQRQRQRLRTRLRKRHLQRLFHFPGVWPVALFGGLVCPSPAAIGDLAREFLVLLPLPFALATLLVLRAVVAGGGDSGRLRVLTTLSFAAAGITTDGGSCFGFGSDAAAEVPAVAAVDTTFDAANSHAFVVVVVAAIVIVVAFTARPGVDLAAITSARSISPSAAAAAVTPAAGWKRGRFYCTIRTREDSTMSAR